MPLVAKVSISNKAGKKYNVFLTFFPVVHGITKGYTNSLRKTLGVVETESSFAI
jgi:hypothetical protein